MIGTQAGRRRWGKKGKTKTPQKTHTTLEQNAPPSFPRAANVFDMIIMFVHFAAACCVNYTSQRSLGAVLCTAVVLFMTFFLFFIILMSEGAFADCVTGTRKKKVGGTDGSTRGS